VTVYRIQADECRYQTQRQRAWSPNTSSSRGLEENGSGRHCRGRKARRRKLDSFLAPVSKMPGTFLWIWAEGVEGLSTEWLLGVEKGWRCRGSAPGGAGGQTDGRGSRSARLEEEGRRRASSFDGHHSVRLESGETKRSGPGHGGQRLVPLGSVVAGWDWLDGVPWILKLRWTVPGGRCVRKDGLVSLGSNDIVERKKAKVRKRTIRD
jgi:hypothetical protein